ncbi:MAG TPA: hypothetical protein PLI53_03225 [Geobacteraceae bacterium]|nr:hypothetical protein [Geobacteraceae bacterium]
MSNRSLTASKPLARIVLFLWIAIIIWLSLDPSPPVPDTGIPGWDKLLHAAAYGCLTVFGGWSLPGTPPVAVSRWLLVGFAAITFGGIMEVMQNVITNTRTADLCDLAANAVGVCIVFLAVFIRRKTRRKTVDH